MGIHAKIGLLNREAIEDEIERLIELLDLADAPIEDLEPEEDVGVDDLRDGDGERLYRMLPAYGIDQNQGPINERAASREYHLRMREGWR